jgi:cytoplasmic tRNA 2-thiolation protein 2
MLISLRRRLLVEVARKQGFSKVLVGDNATRLAVRLLGDVAQGRGRTIPLDTGFIDDRATDVLLIRPLREFPANEVVMYATFNGLHSVSIPHLTTLEPEHTSIERLTESFVAGLQVDFPSTVSTVFRTGDKLTVGGDTQLLCALCQVVLYIITLHQLSLPLPVKAPTGPPADPTVFTHLSQVDTCDRDVWTRLCYGERVSEVFQSF